MTKKEKIIELIKFNAQHLSVELCGNLPRIELFARQSADGWDCWGDEAPNGGDGNDQNEEEK